MLNLLFKKVDYSSLKVTRIVKRLEKQKKKIRESAKASYKVGEIIFTV